MSRPDDELYALRSEVIRLQGELGVLAERLGRLEAAREPALALTPETPRLPVAAFAFESPAAEPVLAEETPAPRPILPPKPKAIPREWEALIGGQWALWIGSLAVFLAAAFGLAYTWESIPAGLRVAAGFAVAASLWVGAGLSRKRTEHWFSEGLAGAGLGLFYLSTWAGIGLFGDHVTFIIMGLATLAGIAMAVRLNAWSLSLLATIGGFLAPLVLGDEIGPSLPLMVYVAVLNMNVLGVSLFKRWDALGWLGLAGTVIVGAAASLYGDLPPWTEAAFFTFYFAQYAGAACFYSLVRREVTRPHDVLMLLFAAFAYAPAASIVLYEPLGDWRVAFPLVLAAVFGALAFTANRLVPANIGFRYAAGGLANFFLTSAAPVALSQSSLATAWVAEATVLGTLGARVPSRLMARWSLAIAGLAILTIGIFALDAPLTSQRVLLNNGSFPLMLSVFAAGWLLVLERRFTPTAPALHAIWLAVGGCWLLVREVPHALSKGPAYYAPYAESATAVAVVALAGLYYMLGRGAGGPPARAAGLAVFAGGLALVFGAAHDLPGTAPVGVVFGMATVSLAVGWLIWRLGTGNVDKKPEEGQLLRMFPALLSLVAVWGCSLESQVIASHAGWTDGGRTAAFALSLVWTLSALALLAVGITRSLREFRLLALALLGLTVVKVFLFDLSFLDTPLRILSFAGLGLALIGISWLYGRFGIGKPKVEAEPLTEP